MVQALIQNRDDMVIRQCIKDRLAVSAVLHQIHLLQYPAASSHQSAGWFPDLRKDNCSSLPFYFSIIYSVIPLSTEVFCTDCYLRLTIFTIHYFCEFDK